nr:MAG TPA: hypothetical protein [Caudoviricetes sp.]
MNSTKNFKNNKYNRKLLLNLIDKREFVWELNRFPHKIAFSRR